MKKSLIATSSLALLLGTSIALATGWNRESFPPFSEVDTNKDGQVSMQEATAQRRPVSDWDMVNSIHRRFQTRSADIAGSPIFLPEGPGHRVRRTSSTRALRQLVPVHDSVNDS